LFALLLFFFTLLPFYCFTLSLVSNRPVNPLSFIPVLPTNDRDPLPHWLHWLESCPSTNTWAINHAEELYHADVVFTPQQTSGRGQHGRIWHSPPGVFTASFVLDRIPACRLPGLSLAVGLAVIQAVEDLLPDQQGQLQLKWPNDVLLAGRKLAGILCEATTASSSDHTRVVVGIGLNRCVNFAADCEAMTNTAISLHEVSRFVPDPRSLLERLRHYLVQTCEILASDDQSGSSGLAAFLPVLRQRDLLRDRAVILEWAGEQISGQAVGIDAEGCLLVASDGEVRAFAAGRVVGWKGVEDG